MIKPINILNYIKRINSFFKYIYVTYRIMLIILIISIIEKNFSKLKIIKFYLKSTMSQ